MQDEKSAIAWMRKQAKEIDPSIDSYSESSYVCARVISRRIEELEDFVKDVVKSEKENLFLIRQAKKLLK